MTDKKEIEMQGAFYTDEYRNVFLENGYSKEEIDRKVEETFQAMFYGPEDVRIYHRQDRIWAI